MTEEKLFTVLTTVRKLLSLQRKATYTLEELARAILGEYAKQNQIGHTQEQREHFYSAMSVLVGRPAYSFRRHEAPTHMDRKTLLGVVIKPEGWLMKDKFSKLKLLTPEEIARDYFKLEET